MPDNTTTTPPELVEMEILGGIKVKLAPAEAEAYKAASKKHRDHNEELARAIGATKAEKEAAEARAKQEAENAAALKLAKDGEIGKVRELMTAETLAKLNKIGKAIVSSEIKAAVAAQVPGLDQVAISDIVELVSTRSRFNADRVAGEYLSESGAILEIDGKPAGADALVSDFLSKRPHLAPTKVPSATAGKTPSASPASGPALSINAYEALSPLEQARFHQAGGKLLG